MALDDDFSFPFASGGDHKDVVPVLEQIERNTRLLSAAKPSRGGDHSGALSSSPSSTAKAQRVAKATAKDRASGNVAAAARTTADAVARGVTKGFQAALENTAAQLSEVVQDAAKATAEAQKKANLDLVRQQKKLAAGPKSAEALNRYREKGRFASTSKESAARFGLAKTLFNQAKTVAGKSGKGDSDITDAAGQLAAGGPVWGAFRELSEVAGSAKESLDSLRKSTDKSEKKAKKPAIAQATKPQDRQSVRDRHGRFSSQGQNDGRQHRELVAAVRQNRGGRTVVNNESGGGWLSGIDDVMDIGGHLKNTKRGKRVGGAVGGIAKAGKGVLGKGLGLVGAGGLSASIMGGGVVAAGTASGAGIGTGLAGKMMGKLGARAIPVVGQALAVGLAAADGIQSWNDKGLHRRAFGLKDGEQATTGQKAASAAAGVLDMGGLTSFGLKAFGVDTDTSKMAKGIYSALGGLTSSMDQNSRTMKQEPSWLSKLVGGTWLGKVFGVDDKPKEKQQSSPPKAMTGKELSVAANAPTPSAPPATKTSEMVQGLGRESPLSTPKSPAPFQTITPGKNASLDAINAASQATNVDAGTLAKIAQVESNLDPNVKAGTSSAGGLFQFTDGTWNATVAKHGAKHGIAPGASKFDAKANAVMGAELFKETKGDLSKSLGREASDKDAYLGLFLGSHGASKFLKGMEANPNMPASSLVSPDAARANKSIFQAKDGRERSAREVYDLMGGKLDKAGATLEKSGALQTMQLPTYAPASPVASPASAGELDSATLNMPVKTASGIKTPAQMGIKTYADLPKAGQAFAGGHNDPTTTALTAEIMQKTQASYISAQNDTYHQRNAPGSGHTKGVKTDFSYAGLSPEGYKGKHAEISSHLSSKYGMQEGKDFQIISDPHGTGKHIDFRLNDSGRAKVEAQKQQAAQAQGPVKPQATATATPAKPRETEPATQPPVAASIPDPVPSDPLATKPAEAGLSTHQQASLAAAQTQADKARASGNEAQVRRFEALKVAVALPHEQAKVKTPTPAMVEKKNSHDPNSKLSVNQQAQLAVLPRNVEKDTAAGNAEKGAKSQAQAPATKPVEAPGEKKNFYQPGQGTVQAQATKSAAQARSDNERAVGNEAQAWKLKAVKAHQEVRAVKAPERKVESAQDIKAKTPPPPVADNSGVVKALNNMAQQQQQSSTNQERQTDKQSTPNIPMQFDDYTLQMWSHDRA